MMQFKKTLLGSIIAFFVGTSCCWLSSLAIWIGGVGFIGVIANAIEDVQILLISLGVILLTITVFLYTKLRRKNLKDKG